jgi:hypothetical protein
MRSSRFGGVLMMMMLPLFKRLAVCSFDDASVVLAVVAAAVFVQRKGAAVSELLSVISSSFNLNIASLFFSLLFLSGASMGQPLIAASRFVSTGNNVQC